MSKGIRIAVLVVASVCMFALFVTSAYAYSGYHVPCGACHAPAVNGSVTLNAGTNDGTTATYGIVTTGGTEWALFAGYTKLMSGSGATTVSVPAGATYTVFTVAGAPGAPGRSFASASVSPASSWVEPGTPDDTPPTVSSNAVATYNGKATIRIDANDIAGVEGPAWGIDYIYYSFDDGAERVTPVGTSGYALAVMPGAKIGTHKLEFWAQDKAGNITNPEVVANFEILDGTSGMGAGDPTVMGVNGVSSFTYQDLRDSDFKYQGGYAPYGGVSGWYSNPHGGYSATTNKCKVCHAVHRAEGAYYLLRGDSQSDSCDYCHIGGSAHSSKIVYDLNPAGTATTNGHTMGAGQVPDSSVRQFTSAVTVEGSDIDGNDVSEVINVRSYETTQIAMYRFSRHHSQGPQTTGRSGWKPVGPNSLSCFSCHQPHNAVAQVWRPSAFDAAVTADGAFLASGYKLLRRFPSGDWYPLEDASHGAAVGQASGVNTYGMVDSGLAIKVPESTLTAGVNYSTDFSNSKTYTENGYTGRTPGWIAQNISFEYAGTGPAEDPATVNQYALSVWCADCHNLNIGGAEALTNEELGFKAHTERTHPAPFVGSHDGPGQCYSCHRNDLSVMNATIDPVGYGMGQGASTSLGGTASCSQCHYGTKAYYTDHLSRQSDFPHSGKPTDIKLLGSYTVAPSVNGVAYAASFSVPAQIDETNLDAVCIRCHPGIGVHN